MAPERSTDGIVQEDTFVENICDFRYLSETMGGKENLVKEIMNIFLRQVPRSLSALSDSVNKTDYANIRLLVHTIRSSASVMGISLVMPVLHQMEELAIHEQNIQRISELNNQLNSIF